MTGNLFMPFLHVLEQEQFIIIATIAPEVLVSGIVLGARVLFGDEFKIEAKYQTVNLGSNMGGLCQSSVESGHGETAARWLVLVFDLCRVCQWISANVSIWTQASNIAPEVNSLVFCFYLEVDKPHLDLIWPCDHIQYLMRLLPSGRGAQLAASTTCGILHIFPVQYMFHPDTLWINGEGRWFACLAFLRGIAGRCEMKPGTLSCCFAE